MSECKYKASDGWCGCTYGYNFGCKCVANEDSCLDYEPVTNADRIRSMSDEELEQAIGGCGLCGYIQEHDQQWCDDMPDCTNCVVQWLKSPCRRC